jgi:hypothetical protein
MFKGILKKINYGREVRAYTKYASLNAARKASENSNVVYSAFDKCRRIIGFVK